MEFLLVAVTLSLVIWLYFKYNPLAHGNWFMMRRFINWFPLGMSYAFLYMARYNIIASQRPLGMSNEAFGMIFGAGAATYGLSLIFNGPVVDKIGGKKGIMISTVGAAIANVAIGYLSFIWITKKPAWNVTLVFAVLYSLNMYFQSFGAVSIIKVKAYWFHVRERGVFGAIFGTLISLGVYLAFDWGQAIVDAADVHPTHPTWLHSVFASLFNVQAGQTNAVWLVYYLPAAALLFWAVADYFSIKDTPLEAGLEDLDTADASSGEMHKEFTLLDLMKRVFLNPIMLMIAFAEFFEGVVRNGIIQWYKPFVEQVPQLGTKFFYDHWGFLLFVSGIAGGFAGGYTSDKFFQSRRFPPTAVSFAFLIAFLGAMAFTLFNSPMMVGTAAVMISFLTIAITALMSGTAASDFGGRKATATAAGTTDAFVYFGASFESFSMALVIKHGWIYWPVLLIPFAIGGFLISIKMWNYLPEATRRYLLVVEKIRIASNKGTLESTTSLEVDEASNPSTL